MIGDGRILLLGLALRKHLTNLTNNKVTNTKTGIRPLSQL